MKPIFKILIISLLLANCSSLKNSKSEVIAVVTEKETLDKYVGKLITIKGKIRNTKIRTIIGVDVEYLKTIEKETIAMATGVLRKKVVTDADDYSANRGNGIFFWLQHPNNKYVLANANLVEE